MSHAIENAAYFAFAFMACFGVFLHGVAAIRLAKVRRDQLELIRGLKQSALEQSGKGVRT